MLYNYFQDQTEWGNSIKKYFANSKGVIMTIADDSPLYLSIDDHHGLCVQVISHGLCHKGLYWGDRRQNTSKILVFFYLEGKLLNTEYRRIDK